MPAASPLNAPLTTILALITDPTRAGRLRAAYGSHLQFCDSHRDLVVASRSAGVELVMVQPLDGTGGSIVTTVAAIRASRQGAPLYVYADRSAECMRELMPLARAGARGIIVRDVDDDAASLRRLLARGSLTDALETITLAVHQIVPVRQRPLILLCLERIHEPQPVTAFARRLGVSRRTLTAWAAKSGAKGVRSLTSKCRVLTAIELIRDSGRSIEHVAHTLRFASSAHLHNTIRRYTALTPREAATHDSAWWCQRLLVTPELPPAYTRPPPAEWLLLPNDATLHPRQDPILRSLK